MMNKGILNIIFCYFDIDEYYKIKDEFKLSVQSYCTNVNFFTKRNQVLHIFRTFNCLLKINKTEVIKTDIMDWASDNNYFEVIKYLHLTKKDCTTDAMDLASENGHLEVVKYLHSIKKDCTIYAIHHAVRNGNLNVVKFLLHKIKKKVQN